MLNRGESTDSFNITCEMLLEKIDTLFQKVKPDSDEHHHFVIMKCYVLNAQAEYLLEQRDASAKVLEIINKSIELSQPFGTTDFGAFAFVFGLTLKRGYAFLIDDGDEVIASLDSKAHDNFLAVHHHNEELAWDAKLLFGIAPSIETEEFRKYNSVRKMNQLVMSYWPTMPTRFECNQSDSGLKETKLYQETAILCNPNKTVEEKAHALNIIAEEVNMLLARYKYKQANMFLAIAASQAEKLRHQVPPDDVDALNLGQGRIALCYAVLVIHLTQSYATHHAGATVKMSTNEDVVALNAMLSKWMNDDAKKYASQIPEKTPSFDGIRQVLELATIWNKKACQYLVLIDSVDRTTAMFQIPDEIAKIKMHLSLLRMTGSRGGRGVRR